MTVTQTEHTAHTTQTTGTTKALTASGPKAARPASGPAFALLGTVQMTLIFALTSLIVPLPAIGREFTLGRDDLMLLSAAYGLSFAGLLLFGGRLTDRFGGRRVLTAGLLLFAVASLAAPFAQGSGTLLTARFAQGWARR